MSVAPASSSPGSVQQSPAASSTWPHQLDHAPTLRVGDVLAALGGEFASLSPSKLRFLDAQGLVSPGRTPAGYRLYSASDLERLRYVLRQQRDAYAPLTVIRSRLELLDAGVAHEPVSLSTVAHDHIGVDELAALASVDIAAVKALIDEGVIEPSSPGLIDREQLPLALAALALAAAGADARQVRSLVRLAQREAHEALVHVGGMASKALDDDAVASIDARVAAAAELFRVAIMNAAGR